MRLLLDKDWRPQIQVVAKKLISSHFIWILCFLVLTNSIVVAAEIKPDNSIKEKWYLQVGFGVDMLVQDFNTTNRSSGIGGKVSAGLMINNNWSFWLTESYYDLPRYNSDFSNLQKMEAQFFDSVLSTRYSFGSFIINPYLEAGLGFLYAYTPGEDVFSKFSSAYFHLDPMVQGSFGVQIPFNKNLSSFFIETKFDFIFDTPPNSGLLTCIDLPINIGFMQGL